MTDTKKPEATNIADQDLNDIQGGGNIIPETPIPGKGKIIPETPIPGTGKIIPETPIPARK